MKRPTVESSLAIDVRRWHRDGLLRPGSTFSWEWSCDDKPLASIGVAVETDVVLLTFEWRRRGDGEWLRASPRVPLTWTRCHFGGARTWFQCPKDARDGRCCGRRVAKLYAGRSHLFACRACCGLPYACQSDSPPEYPASPEDPDAAWWRAEPSRSVSAQAGEDVSADLLAAIQHDRHGAGALDRSATRFFAATLSRCSA